MFSPACSPKWMISSNQFLMVSRPLAEHIVNLFFLLPLCAQLDAAPSGVRALYQVLPRADRSVPAEIFAEPRHEDLQHVGGRQGLTSPRGTNVTNRMLFALHTW